MARCAGTPAGPSKKSDLLPLSAMAPSAVAPAAKKFPEAAPMLLYAAKKAGADILVAGAFGHPRLQEFIFGGTPRSLLAADSPSLFLSH